MTAQPGPDDALDLVLRNSPISDRYMVGCFVDRLFEEAHFDAAGCEQLEGALLALVDTPALAACADRHVFAIYRLVAIQLLCHLNPNDASVDNLDDDAAIDLKNRFDFVVGSFYCRERFERDAWWQSWRAERRVV